MEDNDVQQHLKKRARRRLVGAIFFVSLVAVLVPTLMDSEPRPPAQDIDIRIPGQDDKAFTPALVPPAEPVAASSKSAPEAPEMPPLVRQDPVPETPAIKPPAAVVIPKQTESRIEPKVEPKAEKKPAPAKEAPAKAGDKDTPALKDEASRAAAILAGKAVDAPASAAGQHVVLIGAFSNEANVANLRKKLGEQGIKVYTEALDSPQGKKTRVRAGPFPNREAAEKALKKMQQIGVSGVVAAKP